MLGSGQTEKGETVEEQSQALAYYFDIMGTVHKEFVLAPPNSQFCILL
jgi:hypothetical protein